MIGELNGIVNPTLRKKKIDKSIVGKLSNAKGKFGLGHPVKKILKFTDKLAEELYKQSLENFREGEST